MDQPRKATPADCINGLAPVVTEREYRWTGRTVGAADRDRDLVHELSRRLDGLWRIDDYIANSDGRPALQRFWRELKEQERQNITRLKQLLVDQIQAEGT